MELGALVAFFPNAVSISNDTDSLLEEILEEIAVAAARAVRPPSTRRHYTWSPLPSFNSDDLVQTAL